MKKDFFEKKYNIVKDTVTKLEKEYNKISAIRFVVFSIMFLSVLVGLYDNNNKIYIVSIVMAIIFLLLITKHNKVEWAYKESKAQLNKASHYIKRFNGEYDELEYDASEFALNAPFINTDLDLIGKGSLIQFISNAKSTIAKKELFRLFNELDEISKIKSRQEAAHELASNSELSFRLCSLIDMFETSSSEININDGKYLTKDKNIFYLFMSYFYPLLSFALLMCALLNIIPIYFAAIVIILNIILLALTYRYNHLFLENILYGKTNLDIIVKVLEQIEVNNFSSTRLMKYNEILREGRGSIYYLKELIKLRESVESQQNVLFYFLINIITMLDFRNVYKYNKWKQNLEVNSKRYLDIFYDIEVLLSLATIEQVIDNVCKPDFREQDIVYEVVDLSNPLLNQDKVVSNNFNNQRKNSFIITGSNMSGKTTFIRSIGLNALLAYAGSYVCASKMSISLMKVFTSIRVEDDFSQGISTFYAELNRIKNMIDYLGNNQPMLCLIDEIFKGTNSEDRVYGATSAIEKLNKSNVISFVTTHDAQLCELDNVVNYHFAEYYDNDKINFDYQLKPGPCKTRNAKYLLKMVGITD